MVPFTSIWLTYLMMTFNIRGLGHSIQCKTRSYVPKQELYRYLQTRNLITTLKRAGQLSLALSRMEEILENSRSSKGDISLIYGALLEHNRYSLTLLKTVRQKDLGLCGHIKN